MRTSWLLGPLVLKSAQDEKKCRANVSMPIFCWNKFKLEYVKIKIFYRAILSQCKKISVTHFTPKRLAHNLVNIHWIFIIQNPTVRCVKEGFELLKTFSVGALDQKLCCYYWCKNVAIRNMVKTSAVSKVYKLDTHTLHILKPLYHTDQWNFKF